MLKELLKSANINQNDSKNKSGTVFYSQCIVVNTNVTA